MKLGQRLAAEAGGSLFLAATVVGSGIMAETLAQGNVAVALLANAAATAAMLFVLIELLGPVSGAHFNPAVSLAFWLRRELGARELALYVLVQAFGAALGVLVAHAMFDQALFQPGDHARTGPGQWFSEAVATFGLLATILLGVRHRPQAVPALVAGYIFAAYWFTASTSFANPALSLARALTRSFAGIAPADVPAFVAAQLAGALLAVLLLSGTRRQRA
jgi:glycerol uptake facilitator-like aquaporin